MQRFLLLYVLLSYKNAHSFQAAQQRQRWTTAIAATPTAAEASTTALDEKRQKVKSELIELLGASSTDRLDPLFVDPVTKDPLRVKTDRTFVSGDTKTRTKFILSPVNDSSRTFVGYSDSYVNLLEPVPLADDDSDSGVTAKKSVSTQIAQQLLPFIPPPLRGTVSRFVSPNGDAATDDYIPMRDLFTSPAVSYAYERGWRQNFQTAGFPGPDREAAMAMDYFAPALLNSTERTLVDMSCATGLFTRRFANSKKYQRVIGADYSASMLREASSRRVPGMELVQLDVGQIPLADGTIDALHAGAAMHCWPDLPAAMSEIHRVLRSDGGRFFATTFLSDFFRTLQSMQGDGASPSEQAFQYFRSVDEIRTLLENGGFEREKISIEVLGSACVVIRCEK